MAGPRRIVPGRTSNAFAQPVDPTGRVAAALAVCPDEYAGAIRRAP
jgi:hypothetical protein